MRPVPIQPLQTTPSDQVPQRNHGRALSAARWLKQRVLAQDDEIITSLGELLLPTLLGAMEACWVSVALLGLASTGLLNLYDPLLPIWAPFVYIVGGQWLVALLERRAARSGSAEDVTDKDGAGKVSPPQTPLLFLLIVLLSLFITWLQVYSSTTALYDLAWLSSLASDVLFLDLHFYQALFILALSFYLFWRSLRLLNQSVEPSQVSMKLWLGLGIILAVILLRAGLQSAQPASPALRDTLSLFLLIPLFLFLALAAHALARIVFIRKTHYTGLQGSVLAQERAVLAVISSLGLILLFVTIATGMIASPSFFSEAIHVLTPIGQAIANAYNWLIGLFVDVLIVVITPIAWLISLLIGLLPHVANQSQNTQAKQKKPQPPLHPASNTADAILPYVNAIVPLLLLAFVAWLVWRSLRKRRSIRVRFLKQDEDMHESLWSWLLLWSQVKGLLFAFLRRFFSRAQRDEEAVQPASEVEPGDAAARDIRAIYRALLRKAGDHGYPRKKDETPVEYCQRLDEATPLAQPQLATITEAYSTVRYGGSRPGTAEVALVREQWRALDQKWV